MAEALLFFGLAALGLLLSFLGSGSSSNGAKAASSGAAERADMQAEWRMTRNLDRANPSDVIVVDGRWYVVIGFTQRSIIVTRTGNELLLKKVERFITHHVRPRNNTPGETGYVILRRIVRDAFNRIKNAPSLDDVLTGEIQEIDRGQLISDLTEQLEGQRLLTDDP